MKKEHRGKGYGRQIWDTAWKSLDHNCTVVLDGVNKMVPTYEFLGFQSVWKTSIAMVDLTKVIKILSSVNTPPGVSCVPIRTVDFEKIFEYDTSVFGASRRILLEKYVNLPGSLSWTAVNEKGDVLGYNLVRQFIIEGGKFILCMAPLYADNDVVAKALFKVATETYLAIDAIEGSNITFFYSDSGSYGDHASRMVVELEPVKIFSTMQRMFTKGSPPGTQISKMYGLFSVAF